MAWSTPSARSAGEFIDEAIWNQDVVANQIALREGGLALASQAAGDIIYASGASQLARLAITNNRVLISSGGAPVWGSTLPAVSGANLTSLNASNISSGTLDNARLPSAISVTSLAGAGSGITGLNADAIASGNLAYARLPNGGGTWTTSGDKTFGGASQNNIFLGPIIGQRNDLPQLAIRRANASNQWNFWADDASGFQLSKVSVGTALTIDGSLDVDVPNTLTAGAIVSDSIITAVGAISSVDDVVADSAGTPVSLKDHETRITDLENAVGTLIDQVGNLCNGQPC